MKYLDEFYKKVLFTTSEVSELYEAESTKYGSLNSYVQSGRLKRIKRGLYAAVDPMTNEVYANKFEIATKASEFGYVAYHSALEYHGLHTQVFNTVYIASDKRIMPFSFDDISFECTLNKNKQGVVEEKNNSIIRMTNVERTIVDCIDRIDLAGGIEELIFAIENTVLLDETKLIKYLEVYNKNFLYQKTGYIFSNIKGKDLTNNFYEKCKQRSGKRKNYLIENDEIKYKLDKDWGIISPIKLFNKESFND